MLGGPPVRAGLLSVGPPVPGRLVRAAAAVAARRRVALVGPVVLVSLAVLVRLAAPVGLCVRVGLAVLVRLAALVGLCVRVGLAVLVGGSVLVGGYRLRASRLRAKRVRRTLFEVASSWLITVGRRVRAVTVAWRLTARAIVEIPIGPAGRGRLGRRGRARGQLVETGSGGRQPGPRYRPARARVGVPGGGRGVAMGPPRRGPFGAGWPPLGRAAEEAAGGLASWPGGSRRITSRCAPRRA